jgi:hypothetical protein
MVTAEDASVGAWLLVSSYSKERLSHGCTVAGLRAGAGSTSAPKGG